jgi:hypothetical protein
MENRTHHTVLQHSGPRKEVLHIIVIVLSVFVMLSVIVLSTLVEVHQIIRFKLLCF